MKYSLTLLVFILSYSLQAQEKPAVSDSIVLTDSIMKEMDDYLNSLIKAKSFLDINFGIGTGFYNFKNASLTYTTEKKILLSPSISYYHKSGLSLSVATYIINDSAGLNDYQYALTPSYDYIKSKKWSTGIAYTRYFTKDNLSFYTTPLENEVSAYVNYKKWWLQPSIVVCYGWGSKTSFRKRKLEILNRRLQRDLYILLREDESIQDFSLLFSLKHNFKYYKVFSSRGMLTITPTILLSAGTQNFGFNTSFQSRYAIRYNALPSNNTITDKRGLDLQSATTVLRFNYSIGKFYLQPQGLLDYYLHTADKRVNTAFSLIAGISF